MEKMDSNGLNIKKENIEKIKQLFPECIVEDSIDFNILKIILGDAINTENEKYSFSWNGKMMSLSNSITPSTSTLIPCKNKSVNWDSTSNIYVEGDNLETLKTLLKTYHNKVNLIYIDPPYNTGNDFIYFDDFKESESGYTEKTNQKMKSNPETSGRYHTNWLNMMYPRLKLACEFLNENGVIFISIDDNEVVNLRKICDEIFGATNFEGEITYVRKTSGKQDSSNFVKSTEYILVYSKNSSWDCKKLIAGDNVTERYNKVDKDGKKYRETDLRKTGNADRREDRPLMFYPFYFNEKTNDLQVRKERDQALLSNGYIEILPIKPDGSEGRWRWGYSSSAEAIDFLVAKEMPKYKGKYTIYEIDYIDKNGEVRTVREHTFWDRKEFNSDNAMLEFKALGFSNQLFPFPKSTSLLKHIVYLANFEDGIVMDFFSGSGTTAQSVMQLNSEDGGHRKFILVQLPEVCEEGSEAKKCGYETICDLGEERIRRAGKIIYDELKQKKESAGLFADTTVDPDSIDLGFKVFKLDSTCIKPWDPTVKYDETSIFGLEDVIKEDRTNLDVAYEVMLKYGVFNMPLEEIQVNGKTVYSVGCGYMIISLNKEITPEDVEAIAKLQPKAVVFKESGFVDDNAKINADYTFKRLGIDNVKCI